MKRTSRRTFGKQLSGAIASMSVGSIGAAGYGQRPQTQKSTIQAKMFTHDTPPPTELLDGSLALGTFNPLKRESGGAGAWVYDKGDDVDAAIEHIRVLKGNGEMIYQNLAAAGSTIVIDLENTNTGAKFASLKISVVPVGSKKVFRIESSHKLPYQNPAGQGTKHRPYKYEHPGPGGNNEFRVGKITITNLNHQFVVTAPNAGVVDAAPEEYRVLIWHEGD